MFKKILTAILVVASISLAPFSAHAQGKNAPAAKSNSGLPFAISAHGNSYTVTGYTIGEAEHGPFKGRTTITLTGTGFEKIPKDGGSPFKCNAISNGKEYDIIATIVTRRNVVNDVAEKVDFGCVLNTSDNPDTIILYTEDNPGRKARIQVSPGK